MSVSSNDKEGGTQAAPGSGAAESVTQTASATVTESVSASDDPEDIADAAIDPSEEKPMLRPLEAFPVDGPGGQKLLALYDPSGIAPQPVTLPPLGAAVIDLCDGTRNRAEILAEFAARYRRALTADALEALLKKLDDALLLDSTNFRLHCAKIYADFAQSPSRPPLGAGTLYPTGVDDLIKGLESAFAAPNGPGLAVPETAGKAPRAMLLPSVEIKSGGPAYAWALKPLLDAAEFPTLIVLLGCDHGAADPMLTLTRKHYQTPIGELQTDVELVDAIIADATAKSTELGELVVRDEFHHRNEHSLELLAIWLRFVLDQRKKRGQKDADPKVVPVLCGSLHDFAAASGSRAHEAQDTRLMDEVVHLIQQRVGEKQGAGERVLWIASADLAHVGPRFGDPQEINDDDRDSLERRDRQTLKPLLMGDGQTFLAEIKRERDRRHVVGLGTIYTFLQAARPTGGVLRCYAQCSVSPSSFISTASAVFP
jgi:AmmeMemoRadiSam system protein B